MLNKKWIVIIICTISIFIITKSCTNFFSEQIRNDIKSETEKSSFIIETSKKEEINDIIEKKYLGDWEMAICDMLYEEINVKELPLSGNFINKYKTIHDIFKRSGKISHIFENNYFDSYNEDMENIITVTYKTGNDYEEIAYQLHYIINDNNELDDIEILDSRVYRNADGDYLKYVRYEYYYDNPVGANWALCYPYVRVDKNRDYDRVYVTENFIKKFPNYLTTGITGDTDYIMFGEHYQDENDDKVCYAEFLGLEWIKTYKLTYDIDEKGYVDDVEVELYEKHKTEDPEYIKSYYQEYLDNVGND